MGGAKRECNLKFYITRQCKFMVKPVVEKIDDVEAMPLEGGGDIRWLITHRNGALNFSMRYITVPGGKSTPAHRHDYEHEIFILDGEGEAELDGSVSPVSKDSFIFIPGGAFHTIRAKTDMKLICVVPVEVARMFLDNR